MAVSSNSAAIGWTIGWNILGPWITNSEIYNRFAFGKGSSVYQEREREWLE